MKLFKNISELRTVSDAGTIKDAALIEEDGIIRWVGIATDVPAEFAEAEAIDCDNRAVLPGWVDSHTHMIFDGNRAEEFEARMAGADYAAGGIAVTMEATRSAGAQRLEKLLVERIQAGHAGGTTTFETKTGYGLNTESELEAAQVAALHADDVTFLGAHLVPPGADAEEYVDEVVGPMLEQVAPHVDWIDVFCERGAFNEAQSIRETLDRNVVATATGLANMGGFTAGMIAAQIFGIMLDKHSGGTAFVWGDFRYAALAVLVVWTIGLLGILITHGGTRPRKIRMETVTED